MTSSPTPAVLPDPRALIQDLLWVIDRSHGHRHVEAAERARVYLAIPENKAECSEHDAYRLRLIAEADCACRIPAPFDEVADHLAAIAFDEGVKRRLATPPASDAAGAGYVLVPIEPTEAMIKAGIDPACTNRVTYVEDIYAAMLAAAPKVASDTL